MNNKLKINQMKKIKLTIFCVLISMLNIFGQDYQAINSNKIAYFDNQYRNIKCIRIDSAKYQKDSVLFPFAAIQQLDYDCFSPNVASWIGKKVIVKETGENIFFNKFNDTIIINTKAELGDKWIAYKNTNSLTIEATVIHKDTMSFLGLNDSVKTIDFKAFDENMQPLDFSINNMSLEISKKYGFVKTFNFYLFPNFKADYPYEDFEEFTLIGLSNPKLGIQNLTWFEVNDFQVGDELHVLDKFSYWDWVRNDYLHTITIKEIYKYLERIDYPNSIVYRYSLKKSIHKTWPDSSSLKFYNDTLKTTIESDPLFDKLPGEPVITDYMAFSYYMTNETHVSKSNPGLSEEIILSGDSCWSMIVSDGCMYDTKYIKGLGGPYYSYSKGYCSSFGERKPVFYKKNDVIWGSPLVITAISEIETNSIKVFPNPAKDYINIYFGGDKNKICMIKFFDIGGRLIKSKNLEFAKSIINISDLETGIYFYKLTEKDKILKIDKLIIE